MSSTIVAGSPAFPPPPSGAFLLVAALSCLAGKDAKDAFAFALAGVSVALVLAALVVLHVVTHPRT